MDPWLRALLKMLAASGADTNPIAITTASGPFLARALNRIALIISPPLTNRFTIKDGPLAVLDQGLTIYPGNPPVLLNLLNCGQYVTENFSAISAGANQTVNVIEVIGPFQ